MASYEDALRDLQKIIEAKAAEVRAVNLASRRANAPDTYGQGCLTGFQFVLDTIKLTLDESR